MISRITSPSFTGVLVFKDDKKAINTDCIRTIYADSSSDSEDKRTIIEYKNIPTQNGGTFNRTYVNTDFGTVIEAYTKTMQYDDTIATITNYPKPMIKYNCIKL